MDKDFLNDVKFEKKIKLKKPKKRETKEQLQKEKAARGRKRFRQKLLRLVYFLIMVFMLWHGTMYCIGGVFSASSGNEVTAKMVWDSFWEGFNEEYEEK